MILKPTLLIDLGNSETRVYLLSGNKSFRFNLSNKFATLQKGYKVSTKYANNKSTVFVYGETHFANGLIVSREFVNKETRSVALSSKADLLETDLSLNLAIIKSIELLSQVYNKAANYLDITFNIGVLLPPLDHVCDEGKMIEKIRALRSVQTLTPTQAEYTFKIGDVVVESEAVSAFFGAFYKEINAQEESSNKGKKLSRGDVLVLDNGPHVELDEVTSNTKFGSGYTLVVDIGAGTTDFVLFLDMSLVEKSKDSYNRGGNTVESIARRELKRRFRFSPADMTLAITQGIIEEGGVLHDVSDIITLAKNEYSKEVVGFLRSYLEGESIDVRMLKGLLVVGGGALDSKRYVTDDGTPVLVIEPEKPGDKYKFSREGVIYEEGDIQVFEKVVSPAMSDILIKYLSNLAPNIEVLDTTGKDLRSLNIDGLLYLVKYA